MSYESVKSDIARLIPAMEVGDRLYIRGDGDCFMEVMRLKDRKPRGMWLADSVYYVAGHYPHAYPTIAHGLETAVFAVNREIEKSGVLFWAAEIIDG